MGDAPLPVLVLAFAVAAVLVWLAGSQLPRFAATIAEKTGIGHAFAGLVILGGITSLPELATSTSAAAIGASTLALNNILGSVAFNLVLLAIADAILGKSALTSIVAKPATLMQGVLCMMILALIASAIAAGDRMLFGVGIWSSLLFAACLGAMWIAFRYEKRPMWIAVGAAAELAGETDRGRAPRRLVFGTLALAILILGAGTVLSVAGEAIADRTGLGEGLAGLVLVAAATSLPELSAIFGAMKLRRYELAVGEVFGSNLFNLSLVFVIDLVSPDIPVLDAAGTFEITAALIGLVLTGLFVVGLLERNDRTRFRMGYDSIAVVLLYVGGLGYLAGRAL